MKTYWRALGLSRLLLVSAALVPSLAGAQSISPGTATAVPATAVADVQVARAGDQTVVRIAGSGLSLGDQGVSLPDFQFLSSFRISPL